jgi:MFS family permease
MKLKGLRNIKVFYGWWIVGAVFLISGYVAGIAVFGFTAIFEPIAREFAWSYAQVSVAASIRGMEASLLAPVVGLIFDRFGPRRLIFTGAAIIGLGLLLLSRINSLWTFYGVFVLIAVGISTCTGVVQIATAGNWFRKRVTMATGIATSGTAFAGLLVPLVTQIIDIFEWRMAMVIFGLSAWGILLPLSLLVRHKPEQYGYLPDGETSRELVIDTGITSAPSTEVDIGVKQAIKSSAFWHISLSLLCHMFVINAVVVHVMPYLSTIGIARTTSSLVASGIPVISVCGRLSFGWFGDKYDKRRVVALAFALLSLSILLFGLIMAIGTWLLVPFLILLGIGFGGPVPVLPAILRGYYGRANLGTIFGLVSGIAAIGMATGAPLAGWIYDSLGSYQTAWFAFTGVAVVGFVSMITAPSIGQKIPAVNKSGNRFS